MAYNLQLHYDGYQDDLLERVHEKMKFERERFMNTNNKQNVDTFEKFVHYTEEDELSGSRRQTEILAQSISKYNPDKQQTKPLSDHDHEKKRMIKQQEKVKSEQIKLEKQIAATRDTIATSAEQINSSQLQGCCQICRVEADPLKKNNVLQCNVCFKRYHDTCHDPQLNAPLVYKSRNLRQSSPWQCQDCKVCNVCKLANQEENIIICEMCDIAVHIHCLDPPLKTVPSKSWYCNDCIQCLSCLKKLNPVSKYEQAKWNEWSDSNHPQSKKRLCTECHVFFTNGNFCCVCLKTSPEDCDESFVGCDQCDKWVHAACDGIKQHEFEQMQLAETQYHCPICRKNKEKQPSIKN